jgi:ornithine cyclodeaminase
VNVPWLGAGSIHAALGMAEAIDRMEERLRIDGFPDTPPRGHVDTEHGLILTMPSFGRSNAGVKLVTVAPNNGAHDLPLINGVYVLFDAATLVPVATMDAAALTALRTAAVSAVATRHLACREDVNLVVFGAGAQARAHVEAIGVVRGLRSVAVVDSDAARAEQLVARLRASGVPSHVAGADAVADADVVCTCTTSSTPVFDGTLLPPGAHVNAVGSFLPQARELDDATARRARFVVETRDAAMAEAGDLLLPLREGVIGPERIVGELPDLLAGRLSEVDGDLTVFKSVGHAYEDLIVAEAVFEAVG